MKCKDLAKKLLENPDSELLIDIHIKDSDICDNKIFSGEIVGTTYFNHETTIILEGESQ